MKSYLKGLLTVTLLGSAVACGNFLTAGETSTDPNRPVVAGTPQYFVGVQSNIWASYTGDMSRVTGMWAQHFTGVLQQYGATNLYQINEQTTNGAEVQLFLGGGLVDARKEQASAIAANDTLFLGIAQVQEAMLMGLAADVFGNITYTHALKNEVNPPLDPQLAVYDSLQVLLSKAIVNMGASSSSNVGPGDADLVYGGDAASWIALAHTLKARFYMHTAEARGGPAYASALTEAQLGITGSRGADYTTNFSGNPGEQNMWYQFDVVQRAGYLTPGHFLDSLMAARGDPRRSDYFALAGAPPAATDISDARLAPKYNNAIVSAVENLLIWAEAAQRGGNNALGLTQLNAARALTGRSTPLVGLTGNALLTEILTEKYISDFQLGVEAWKDYKRTCFPNLTPTVSGGAIPGRWFYDAGERQTNTNIPAAGTGINGYRTESDPQNATADGVGGACKAGA